LITNFEGGPYDWGFNWGGVVSDFAMLYLVEGAR